LILLKIDKIEQCLEESATLQSKAAVKSTIVKERFWIHFLTLPEQKTWKACWTLFTYSSRKNEYLRINDG